ncbi:MAPEG family protein [Salinicola avicenniae]|uniref:MAPEG family protein n=1 Tax=Salinicola avicenniae TaxID=2916836 RepID=UPI002073F2B1|nr:MULTISPECIES: MAPEG family protein [unclassified Salinicola]
MNLPLWCLLITALLPFWLAFWGSHVRRRELGHMDNHHPRQQYAQMTGMGARLWAAQQNAWEALALFTAAVVAVQTTGGGWLADVASVVFVLARIAHALCYAFDRATLRSSVFIVAFLAVLCLFFTALV